MLCRFNASARPYEKSRKLKAVEPVDIDKYTASRNHWLPLERLDDNLIFGSQIPQSLLCHQ